MKIIGLIGGTTWISTLDYYRIINETIRKKLGRKHSAHCILYSVDFERFIAWSSVISATFVYISIVEFIPTYLLGIIPGSILLISWFFMVANIKKYKVVA